MMAKADVDSTVAIAEKSDAHAPTDSVEASEDVDFVVENVRARVSTPVVMIPSKKPATHCNSALTLQMFLVDFDNYHDSFVNFPVLTRQHHRRRYPTGSD